MRRYLCQFPVPIWVSQVAGSSLPPALPSEQTPALAPSGSGRQEALAGTAQTKACTAARTAREGERGSLRPLQSAAPTSSFSLSLVQGKRRTKTEATGGMSLRVTGLARGHDGLEGPQGHLQAKEAGVPCWAEARGLLALNLCLEITDKHRFDKNSFPKSV